MSWHLGRPEIRNYAEGACGHFVFFGISSLDGDEDLDVGDKVWLRRTHPWAEGGVMWQGAEVEALEGTLWYLRREEEFLWPSDRFASRSKETPSPRPDPGSSQEQGPTPQR